MNREEIAQDMGNLQVGLLGTKNVEEFQCHVGHGGEEHG